MIKVLFYLEGKKQIMTTEEKELKEEYEKFIQTKEGKEWINHWQKIIGSDNGGDFGDYLYDFYPEMIS